MRRRFLATLALVLLAAFAGPADAATLLKAPRGTVTVSAAGTTQAGATALAADNSYVTSGTGGVALPSAYTGQAVAACNATAAQILVYPVNGGSAAIGAMAANTPMALGPGLCQEFNATSTTAWVYGKGQCGSGAPGVFIVACYGAVGNGVADDTAGMQLAEYEAETYGGGTVLLPCGTYVTATGPVVINAANAKQPEWTGPCQPLTYGESPTSSKYSGAAINNNNLQTIAPVSVTFSNSGGNASVAWTAHGFAQNRPVFFMSQHASITASIGGGTTGTAGFGNVLERHGRSERFALGRRHPGRNRPAAEPDGRGPADRDSRLDGNLCRLATAHRARQHGRDHRLRPQRDARQRAREQPLLGLRADHERLRVVHDVHAAGRQLRQPRRLFVRGHHRGRLDLRRRFVHERGPEQSDPARRRHRWDWVRRRSEPDHRHLRELILHGHLFERSRSDHRTGGLVHDHREP